MLLPRCLFPRTSTSSLVPRWRQRNGVQIERTGILSAYVQLKPPLQSQVNQYRRHRGLSSHHRTSPHNRGVLESRKSTPSQSAVLRVTASAQSSSIWLLQRVQDHIVRLHSKPLPVPRLKGQGLAAGSWGYYRALRPNQATTLTMASRVNFSPTPTRGLSASTPPHHLLGPTVHTYSKCRLFKISSPNYSWLMILRPLRPGIAKTSWR